MGEKPKFIDLTTRKVELTLQQLRILRRLVDRERHVINDDAQYQILDVLGRVLGSADMPS